MLPTLPNGSAHRPPTRAVATGHYARLAPPAGSGDTDAAAAAAAAAGATAEAAAGGLPRLLRGADHRKDQTYFLASVQPAALRRVLFPVGHLQVR